MEDYTLESLTHGAVELFSLPDIYFQLDEMINDTRFSAEDMGRVILNDPALSARILKIVNSSYYGFQARIDTISRAITIIGIEDLQNLVLATSVVDTFAEIPCDMVDMTAFWMRSVNCGVIARLLAKKVNVLHSERLFLVGLLHDIGSLVLYQKLPQESKQVLLAANHDRLMVAPLEQEVIGFTHADVGGGLIKAWGLPDALSEAVACALLPERALAHKLDAQLLFMASRFCDMVAPAVDMAELLEDLPQEKTGLIAIEDKEVKEVLEQSAMMFSQVFDLIAPNKQYH